MKDYYKEAIKYIEARENMTLATASTDGVPAAHTLSYASAGEVLYFSTDRRTLKVANIKANSKISYVIYDSNPDDWSKIQALQMFGVATILTKAEEINEAAGLLNAKYPKMPDMPAEYDPVFVKIEPKKGVFIDSTVHFGFAAELQY